jgi:uncharacterized protein (TIGR03000 family)
MMRQHPFLTIALSSTFLGLLAEGRVQAQGHANTAHSYAPGAGVYPGPRFYGPRPYPYWGLYPYDYPGFYGNGMSMYGPPVPTYAPVPGTFGGADYGVIQNGPVAGPGLSIGIGFGAYGSGPPVPPPLLPGSVAANQPIVPNGEPPLLDERVLAGPAPNALTVEVRLPIANATVFFDNRLTPSGGMVRQFSSPALKPGATYKYAIRAEWIIDGHKTSFTQLVLGKAGEHVVADFMK